MAKGPRSQRYRTPGGRFWRNVVLIALAHVALIAGLIRWSVAARPSSNPESIVWLGGAGDLSADESEKHESPSPKQPPRSTESSGSKQNEPAEEKPVVTTAKSEIEIPTATPKPTATATPAKPSVTSALRAKTSPKPIPKPTPKKALLAKASPKPLAKPKPGPAKANAKSEKKDKITLPKKDSASWSGSMQSGSTDKAASAGGGSSTSEFGWYGNMLHDRFYSAWIQPTTNVPSGTKISALVNVRIEKDGRVSKFEIAKPSENARANESGATVAQPVTPGYPAPPGGVQGRHYEVSNNFGPDSSE